MVTGTHVQLLREHLGPTYGDFPLLLEDMGDQLLMVLRTPPSCRLRLSEETEYTKQLEHMGLHDEAKIDDPSFDQRYVIRGDNPAGVLSPEFKALLRRLEPFVELELTAREYRLLKALDLKDERAVAAALDVLVELAELTRAQG